MRPRLTDIERLLRRIAYVSLRWAFDRIDRFRRSPPPFDGRLPPPRMVTIETTKYCNLSCRMCLPFLDGITTTGPHMPMETFRRYAEKTFPFVSGFEPSVSGEPLMTKGFLEMVGIAREWGLGIEMTTNGTLLSQRMVEALTGSLSIVAISCDGATKETFEAIRNGASFERVMDNVRRLVASSEKLPLDQRPIIILLCTLMERNIRELPALVELAHDLGVQEIRAAHVFPVNEEMRTQSLMHHRDLANRCIDEAAAAARRLGVRLSVAALGQFIVANATANGGVRELANDSSTLDGLGPREIGRKAPPPPLDAAKTPELRAKRARALEESSFPKAASPVRFPKRCPSIWTCHYLWDHPYVHIGGEVRPCCVDGPPVIASLEEDSFDAIWNNDHYVTMRQHLIAKDPVPVCRGCHHIQEVSDPKAIAKWLQGCSPPDPTTLPAVPELLSRPAASALSL